MHRADFLAGVFALPVLSVRARFQDDDGEDLSDPANSASSQALRVLLGRGEAQRLDGQTFLFAGRRYRGSFAYTPEGEVVSTVPLEQYLYSVVSREMPHSWPSGALQAQAIVARTYVLQRSNPRRSYDLVPSEADQVYTGIDAERPQTTAAVEATAGAVLRFGAAFAQIAYSSCCGGHTEANSNAWGGALLPYLAGVVCPYCAGSPWYAWKQSVPMDRVASALTRELGPIGELQGAALDAPDGSGRAQFWTFSGAGGTQRVKAADVRRALGMRVLPSLLVHRLTADAPPTQAPPTLAIEGGGLGHGVGLCQWGARGMALTGADARAILAFYFPGTEIGND